MGETPESLLPVDSGVAASRRDAGGAQRLHSGPPAVGREGDDSGGARALPTGPYRSRGVSVGAGSPSRSTSAGGSRATGNERRASHLLSRQGADETGAGCRRDPNSQTCAGPIGGRGP